MADFALRNSGLQAIIRKTPSKPVKAKISIDFPDMFYIDAFVGDAAVGSIAAPDAV